MDRCVYRLARDIGWRADEEVGGGEVGVGYGGHWGPPKLTLHPHFVL